MESLIQFTLQISYVNLVGEVCGISSQEPSSCTPLYKGLATCPIIPDNMPYNSRRFYYISLFLYFVGW